MRIPTLTEEEIDEILNVLFNESDTINNTNNTNNTEDKQ